MGHSLRTEFVRLASATTRERSEQFPGSHYRDPSGSGLKFRNKVVYYSQGPCLTGSLYSVQVLPFLIEIARVLPLVIFPALYFVGGDEDFVALGVLLFFVILFFLTLIAAMKTGHENPTRMEKVAR